MEPIISLEKINKDYPHEGNLALHDVSLSISASEFVCIIGPSGCGKSTLLKVIANLEKEDSGKVLRPGDISMVFQSGALLPWLSVLDNVTFALHAQTKSKTLAEHVAREYIAMLGLSEHIHKFPRELSGGQRQRVGIARALAIKPRVLLMDEPFSALDPKTTHELHEDLIKIWHETKVTIIMVSHVIEEAVSLAERVVLMKEGAIKEIFPVDIAYPRHERGEAVIHEVEKIRRVFFA